MSATDWEVRFSKSRQLPYFYNSATGASIWEKPEEISEEQAQSLPGAQYLKTTVNGASAGGARGEADAGSVRASHLLVKHNQSRRASSWKEVSCRLPS